MAGCSRVAPRLRSVPRPRCNHHPKLREAVPYHVEVGAASKTTLAERGGYTACSARVATRMFAAKHVQKTVENGLDGKVNGPHRGAERPRW